MKRLPLILFVLLACGVSSSAGWQAKDVIAEGQSDVPLRGVIVDWQDARIVNASILVEGRISGVKSLPMNLVNLKWSYRSGPTELLLVIQSSRRESLRS